MNQYASFDLQEVKEMHIFLITIENKIHSIILNTF
jgi:hypothetical protein